MIYAIGESVAGREPEVAGSGADGRATDGRSVEPWRRKLRVVDGRTLLDICNRVPNLKTPQITLRAAEAVRG